MGLFVSIDVIQIFDEFLFEVLHGLKFFQIYKQIDICLPAGSSCQPLHSPQRSILCNI